MKVHMKIGRLCLCLFAMVVGSDLHAMMEADKFIGAWWLMEVAMDYEYHRHQ